MKCVVCGRETGASWKRYCYPHWRQYARKGSYAPRRSPAPYQPQPARSYTPPQRKSKLGDIAGTVAGWAFLLAIVGLPIGASAYDSWKEDEGSNAPVRQAPPSTANSQNFAPSAPTRRPAAPTTRPIFTFPTEAPARGATTYTVQSGDGWWAIANKFGITTDALLIANDRNYLSDSLYAGQTLTIPPPALNPVFIPYQGNGGGPTRCRDGTYSHSSGRGTCSHHGGIAR